LADILGLQEICDGIMRILEFDGEFIVSVNVALGELEPEMLHMGSMDGLGIGLVSLDMVVGIAEVYRREAERHLERIDFAGAGRWELGLE
jgi:hypothetical protein